MDLPIPMAEGDEDHDEPEKASVSREVPEISEDKLTERLTEVTEEAVDRAVRETLGEVTEKVIEETLEKAVAGNRFPSR